MRSRAVPLFVLALVSGCAATLPAPVEMPEQPPTPPRAALWAAARRVDITPPPGVSTFGHGPDSRVSEGYWTRIECRAFALSEVGADEVPAPGRGTRIAIVPCDLAASSTLLQREVAARLTGVVPTTRIFMTATHTHAGLAHYLDEIAFGGTESTRNPAFDPEVVRFLADRIASAVEDAFGHLQQAEVRSLHFDEQDSCPSGQCGMWGLTWNRSLRAHLTDAHDPPAPDGMQGVDAAIDSSLHWIELRTRDSRVPIGALAFYAMHPTVLPNTNRLIGADVDGVVSRLLEARLANEAGPGEAPPVGVVNTNEGDMSPVWTEGTKQEAVHVARSIEERIEKLRAGEEAEGRWHAEATLDARYREVDLAKQRTSDGGRTCSRAEAGESVGFGACDHPASQPDSPWPHAPCGDCQSPKVTPMGELEWILAGGGASFPSHVPLGLVRLDDSLIAFVPAEATINAGRIMRQAVLEEDTGASYAFLGGLSNGYILYVTSEGEYRWRGTGGGCRLANDKRVRQTYEGSSNLYGPSVARYLADQLRSLAAAMNGHSVAGIDRADAAPYATGPVRSRLALPSGRPPQAKREAVRTCRLPGNSGSRVVCFRWKDAPVGDLAIDKGPYVRLVGQPLPSAGSSMIPVVGPLGPIDDRGFDFVTRVGVADAQHSEWATLFAVDDSEVAAVGARKIRVEVTGAQGAPPVASAEFDLGSMPSVCTADDLAICNQYNDLIPEHPYSKGWEGRE